MIPGTGPFPYLSGTHDVTEATVAGDPPLPSCQTNVSRSVWFRFTPATGGPYTISLCADGPSGTTVEDTVLAVYTATGDCAGLAEVEGGCDDDGCGAGDLQSIVTSLDLVAGTTYDIVAWKYGVTAPAAGASAVQLRMVQEASPGPAPANDRCEGAEVIPGGGPFPYRTAVTADIGGATAAGDPPPPSCQPNVSRSIWYAFAPARAGRYGFTTCADAPTGTTVDDTVVAVYAGTGRCSGLAELPAACDDDSCLVEAAQSVIRGVDLEAGVQYYVVVWKYDVASPAAGSTAVQLLVNEELAPGNDVCAGAPVLLLDRPAEGTTTNAADDYRLPVGSACFQGIGQTASTAPGRDAVWTFTAPEPGRYSFRATATGAARNLVLYAAPGCPAGGPPATVSGCLGAANRNGGYPGEEVACLPLTGGETVYLFVDEHTYTGGGDLALEAGICRAEGEPNDLPGEAAAWPVPPACGAEGATDPAGDPDFFAMGAPVAGARVFALVDGAAANSSDFDLRITTGSSTLEYDDLNNDLLFGNASPNVAGTLVSGGTVFLRVSHYSPTVAAEPYRLYSAIQPPAAAATPEVEPNDTVAAATSGGNFYYSGALSGTGDLDAFSFPAVVGELLLLGLDLDPGRDGTPWNGTLALLDPRGETLLSVNDGGSTSSTASGAGSLAATTPSSPGEAIVWRVRESGTHYARVGWAGGTPGDYLLSVARDCRVGPPTDLALEQTDGPDPVLPGARLTVAFTLRNLGADPASVVTLRVNPPAEAPLAVVTSSQGTCEVPGPVVCHLGTLASGGTATVEVGVTAPSAALTLVTSARAATAVIDLEPGNDATSGTTVVAAPDADGDGVPDGSDCAPSIPSAWSVPGETAMLLLGSASGHSDLRWSPPAEPGGTVVFYDVLRSVRANDFTAAACLAADLTATAASDPSIPPPGAVFHYLVRSENACGGNLGASSEGTPRLAPGCP
jgi:hypothetical protein